MTKTGKNSDTAEPNPAPPKGETLEGLLDSAAGAARDRGREDVADLIKRVGKLEK